MVSNYFWNRLLSAYLYVFFGRVGDRFIDSRDIAMKESLLKDIENIDKIIDNTSDPKLKEMWKTKKDLKEKIKQRENGTRGTSS